MLIPRRNNFDLFDDFFDEDFFTPHDSIKKKGKSLMKTDNKESNDKYLLDIDLPGFDKNDINISLDKGYLSIHAKVDKEEKNDHDAKIVRQERYHGECSRSFYVGDDIREEDIKANFKNGILKIEVPKKELENKSKEVKQIPIE